MWVFWGGGSKVEGFFVFGGFLIFCFGWGVEGLKVIFLGVGLCRLISFVTYTIHFVE